MGAIAYTVVARFPEQEVRDRYVRWLAEGHARAVVRAGALGARIVVTDPEDGRWEVEARYEFADRASLDRYLRGAAPALRAQGLALFGPETGVRFERRVGAIIGASEDVGE
jgi:hypothetical protein